MAEGLRSEFSFGAELSYCLEKENVRQTPHALYEFRTLWRVYQFLSLS